MARLLQEKGYAAAGRAELLSDCGVSNGSLYHHFPGGMEELAEAALVASSDAVLQALREALEAAPTAGLGVCRFLGLAEAPEWNGCPVAPTALESPIISPRLRDVAATCFEQWESLLCDRLQLDGWPEKSAKKTASAVLALIEGAFLLYRVSNDLRHIAHAKEAALALVDAGHTSPEQDVAT